ncbi:hypothetical protein GGS24DRAFT_506965 [Hypoxylon argillaceum]|nr:hypothetical protein GGS24DRAFT_506965 [Hypoxylon argillaceum]
MSLDQLHLLPPAQQEAILNGPALAPPAGVVPNLDSPPNGNVACIVIVTFLLFLATSAFTLGIYIKLFHIKQLHLEDYLAFAGFALYVAQVYCGLNLVANYGLFVHQWNVRVRDLAGILYMVHIGSEFYAISIVLFKTAILLEWVRIFVPRTTRGLFFWACHTILWTNILFYTIVLIAANMSCKPYAKLWDKTLPGTCNDNNAFDVATATYNLLSDLLILLLPQRIIWRLHLQTKKKIGIAILFGIGISACTAAAFRLYASVQYLTKTDATYDIAGIALGTEAETVCAILVFYVPTFPRVFKDVKNPFRFLASIFSRSKSLSSTPAAIPHREWQDQEYQQIYLKNSHLSAENPEDGISNFGGRGGFSLTHPRAQETYTPHRLILQTSQVSIDEESIYESRSQYFQSAGHRLPLDSSRASEAYQHQQATGR